MTTERSLRDQALTLLHARSVVDVVVSLLEKIELLQATRAAEPMSVSDHVVFDGAIGAYRIERTERRYEQGEWNDYRDAHTELERLREIYRLARHGGVPDA